MAVHISERQRSIAVAMICTSIVGITLGLTWPLLALILENRGISDTLIGLSSASQSAAILFIAPSAPKLVAKFGLLRVVSVSVASIVVCLILLPLYINVYYWFPIRLALGGAVSLLFIAGETWINHLAPPESRGRIIGIFGFLWSAGFAIAPLLINVTGIHGWPPFLVGIALVVIAGTSLPFARGVAPVITHTSSFSFRKLFILAPAALLAAPVLGSIDSINDSLLAIYSIRNGLSQQHAVYLLTILFLGTTIGHLPFGWLADQFDLRTLLFITTFSTFSLTLVVPFVLQQGILLWIIVFLWGAALGGIWTIAIVLLGERYKGVQLASATSLYTAMYSAGSVVGPASTGIMMDTWGPAAVPVIIAGLLLLYLPAALLRR